MPNGFDRPLVELAALCASYRHRFEEWPQEAHLHPNTLRGLALILDWRDFIQLAEKLELSTLAEDDPIRPGFVSGDAGRVGYDQINPGITTHDEYDRWRHLLEQAREWLAVEPREPGGK